MDEEYEHRPVPGPVVHEVCELMMLQKRLQARFDGGLEGARMRLAVAEKAIHAVERWSPRRRRPL